MTREEQIYKEARRYYPNQFFRAESFEEGTQWADENPQSPWIKFTEKCPPQQEPIIIAVKNKNKEDGI